MVHFDKFLKTWSLRSNSVTRQVTFNRTKIGGKCQNSKIQMRHFGWFSNTVNRDFEIHFAKPKIQGQKLKLGNVQGLNKYTYNVDQVRTYHHGMCYKIQPNFQVKITMPIYNYLKVAFKSSEQRPKGFFVYLTSNTSWQGIAFETWPQINPTKIYLKFEDQGQVSGIRHGVWKSQKKSHSTLRAKRATFTF